MPIHGLGAYVIFFAFLAVVFTPFVLIAWLGGRWPRTDREKHPEQWEQLSANQWRRKRT